MLQAQLPLVIQLSARIVDVVFTYYFVHWLDYIGFNKFVKTSSLSHRFTRVSRKGRGGPYGSQREIPGLNTLCLGC